MFFNKGDRTASLWHHCYTSDVLLTRMDTFNDGSRAGRMVGETTVHGSTAFGTKRALKQHASDCFSLGG